MAKAFRKTRKSAGHGKAGRAAKARVGPSTRRGRGVASAVTGERAAASRRSLIQMGARLLAAAPSTLAGHRLDILPDMPDIRDRIYTPHLRALAPTIYPKIDFAVRDQGRDASCTGYSLAHVIDFLRSRDSGHGSPQRVSARMLYEMAKRNDEWAGSTYEGSSIRGAIKGFFRNGVCSETTAPDLATPSEWALTYDMAKEARETRLGAYFRLEPDINDYHSALNDVGVIHASAQIHSNWSQPIDGRIQSGGKPAGGHAFAIVGYNDTGFWILNSWGPTWGTNGVAHWDYKDWAATIMDAWVLQVGVRAPDAFSAVPRTTLSTATGLFGFGGPNRGDIVGHFINIDDGQLQLSGKYASPNKTEMAETVTRLSLQEANQGKGYDHLILYAHGGLNSLEKEAERIATWKRHDIFGRNRLYNFHLMWGSGLIDEVFGQLSESPLAGRAAGLNFDWLFEAGLGKAAGGYAWRNMKQDAKVAFNEDPEYDGGFKGLLPLLAGLDNASRRPKLHLLGHSAGAIVLGHFLSALRRFKLKKLELGSIHLMAPACTVDFFKQHYGPHLSGTSAMKLRDKVYLYNLTDRLELDDTVSADFPLLPAYSRSLLYLVSRAYEEQPNTALAGMQLYVGGMPSGGKIAIDYSDGRGSVTASRTHGGFDNDPATLATVMSRILGMPVPRPPTVDELTGY
jgi:papain like protease